MRSFTRTTGSSGMGHSWRAATVCWETQRRRRRNSPEGTLGKCWEDLLFIGQEFLKFHTHQQHTLKKNDYRCVLYDSLSVRGLSSYRKVMTRAFNNQSVPKVIMPRLSLNAFALCWTLLLFIMVRADLKDRTLTAVKHPVLCECEFFVQSWKTSHMIRLPMGTYQLINCH